MKTVTKEEVRQALWNNFTTISHSQIDQTLFDLFPPEFKPKIGEVVFSPSRGGYWKWAKQDRLSQWDDLRPLTESEIHGENDE